MYTDYILKNGTIPFRINTDGSWNCNMAQNAGFVMGLYCRQADAGHEMVLICRQMSPYADDAYQEPIWTSWSGNMSNWIFSDTVKLTAIG